MPASASLSTFLTRKGRAPFAARVTVPGLSSLPAIVFLAAVAALPARAQTTLFSDLGAGNTYNTGSAYGIAGPSNGDLTEAFEFTATATGTIGSMSAALQNLQGSTAATAEILNNSGSLPGSTVLFSASATVPTSAGIVTFSSASSSTLTAGTSYWAVIFGSTSAADKWFDNSTGVQSTEALTTNNGASYSSVGTNTTATFSVSSAATAAASAPEPGSMVLLGTGLGGALPTLGATAWRRRKAA